ncbi:FecR family protein [uncultured Dokdonia sp.]|uniref:FecR family protein n=1 Tax=uncultured Dokdonia sp. TaxID=575653 RepID=UPI002639534C|nr:FecR family protein [uncultured Dokdonia sp.]
MEKIIIKYLTSNISSEELKLLENWMLDPENKKEFEKLIKTNQELNDTYLTIDTDNAFDIVSKKLDSINNTAKYNTQKKILHYAASIVLCIAISISSYFIFKTNNTIAQNEIILRLGDENIAIINDSLKKKIFNNEGDLIATLKEDTLFFEARIQEKHPFNSVSQLIVPNGKQLKTKLPDGTLININSGSMIKFPSLFDGRKIILDGEAFFDVRKNKEFPFIVSTKQMDIKVLGTRFNVSNYPNNETSFVSLEEGSLAVKRPSINSYEMQNIIIEPGEQVSVKGEVFNVKETNIEKDIAWNFGKLYFENDRFEDIIKKLERHYNIRIQNKSTKLNNTRYTGTFTTETIIEVLDTFNELSEFEYQILGQKIIMDAK